MARKVIFFSCNTVLQLCFAMTSYINKIGIIHIFKTEIKMLPCMHFFSWENIKMYENMQVNVRMRNVI